MRDQKSVYDKFPGVLENPAGYRKSSDDYAVTIAVPIGAVERLQPLMQKAGKPFVVYLVQVGEMAEAEAAMADAETRGRGDAETFRPVAPSPLLPVEVVSLDTLADWLCMQERNVQVLETKGIVFKDGRGKYRLKESVQGYIREMNARGDGKNSDYNRERTAAMMAKRQTAEVEYLERVGKLVDADAVKRAIEKAKINDRQKWLAMPKFLSPRLDGLTAQEIEPVLEDYVRESLAQLASLEIARIGGDGGVPYHGAAAEAVREPVGRRKKKAQRKKRS
jgi:phage terminase Nu1 subunit (DNA packaging protein)